MNQQGDLPIGIFRTYDIRGIVEEDLTVDRIRQIGLGLGLHLAEGNARQIVVGHDVRESSPRFAEAMTEGKKVDREEKLKELVELFRKYANVLD